MAAVNIVKQSVIGRLSGLKFMQRAKIREEELKKEEPEAADESHWVTPGASSSRCKVIVEGDPKPGALIGRMSFQNCNPAVEKFVEEVQARRDRSRNSASVFSGKEAIPVVSTREAIANGVDRAIVELDDDENISMRKRQKVDTVLKVEKVIVAKTENTFLKPKESTFMKPNAYSSLRTSKKESDRHHQQRNGSKQSNHRNDFRSLRPPGR